MKVSELIETLQHCIDSCGDKDVTIDYCCDYTDGDAIMSSADKLYIQYNKSDTTLAIQNYPY